LKYKDLRKEKCLKPEFGIRTCVETNLLKLEVTTQEQPPISHSPNATDENSQMKLALIEKCNFYRNLVNQKYQEAIKILSSSG
jgi:hypothetical protein